MKEFDLIYAAGFIDGEGCFTLDINQSPHGKRYIVYTARLVVVNTNTEVLYWLQKRFEGSVFKRTKQTTERKATYGWRLFGDKLKNLCEKLIPYSIVKKEHIKLILQYRQTFDSLRRQVSEETISLRKQFYIRMRELNKTGPFNK